MEKEGSSTGTDKKLGGGRGKDTLFKVTARNQINLVAIADNKSNIVIGINVLLITVIMAASGSDLMIAGVHVVEKPEFLIPFSILLVCSLLSAVFAIFAAKPKIIKSRKELNRSKLFFNNYSDESLEKYADEMMDVLESREMPYRQLTIDMYNTGIVLSRKYQLIARAYNILMVGLVLSVVSFIILILIK